MICGEQFQKKNLPPLSSDCYMPKSANSLELRQLQLPKNIVADKTTTLACVAADQAWQVKVLEEDLEACEEALAVERKRTRAARHSTYAEVVQIQELASQKAQALGGMELENHALEAELEAERAKLENSPAGGIRVAGCPIGTSIMS